MSEGSREEWLKAAEAYLKVAEEFARTAAGHWDRGEDYVAEAASISQAYSQLAQTLILRTGEVHGWGDA